MPPFVFVEDAQGTWKADPADALDRWSPANGEQGTGKVTEAVHRKKRSLVKARRQVTRGHVRDVMLHTMYRRPNSLIGESLAKRSRNALPGHCVANSVTNECQRRSPP